MSDQIGITPTESAAAPSVAAASSLFQTGLGSGCTAFNPSGDGVSPGSISGDATATVSSHPFCRRLIYQDGSQQQVQSPVDQHYPLNAAGDVWRFDVLLTNYVGNYALTSGTVCSVGSGACIIINNQGQSQGLWPHNHNEICQRESTGQPGGAGGCTSQEYAVNFAYANPLEASQSLLRSTTGQSIAQGNGWYMAIYDQTLVGYLFRNGAPINQVSLNTIVDGYIAAGKLPASARFTLPGGAKLDAAVCGFQPAGFAQSTLADLVSWCEVPFKYVRGETAESNVGGPVFSGYPNDDYYSPCSSKTYFCGMVGGGAWAGYLVCRMRNTALDGFITPQCLDFPNVDTPAEQFRDTDGFDSTRDYEVWHYVVAPSPSACQGIAEPGFVTAASGAAQPYIAHDLDVYAPPGSSAGGKGMGDQQRLGYYYVDQAERKVGLGPGYGIDGGDDGDQYPPDYGNDDDRAASGTGDDVVGDPVIRKDDNLEPNAAGDTSGTLTATRTAAHTCAPVVNPGLQRPGRISMQETQFDPWVNIIDSRVTRITGLPGVAQNNNGAFSVPGIVTVTHGVRDNDYDAYANTAPNQDASNRPVNSWLSLTGRAGLFADADDDFARVDAVDEYEPVFPTYENPTSDPQDVASDLDPLWIQSIGAYTMFWDAWLELSVVAPPAGPAAKYNCKPTWAGTSGNTLTQEMAVAGYDTTRTGLVQVVYNSLPTIAYPTPVQTNADIVAPAVYPAGTALVFLSQGLHELRKLGTAADQAFVAGLISAAVAKLPVVVPSSSVIVARDAIAFGTSIARWGNYQSDFTGQCNNSSGAFGNRWAVLHACDGKQLACEDDTIATGYTFRLNAPIGSTQVPAPPIALGSGVQHTWWDVDPLDNNAARNT